MFTAYYKTCHFHIMYNNYEFNFCALYFYNPFEWNSVEKHKPDTQPDRFTERNLVVGRREGVSTNTPHIQVTKILEMIYIVCTECLECMKDSKAKTSARMHEPLTGIITFDQTERNNGRTKYIRIKS